MQNFSFAFCNAKALHSGLKLSRSQTMQRKNILPMAAGVAAAIIAAVIFISCDKKPPEKTESKVAAQTELCSRHQLSVADCFMCDPA
ncbi:MAG: hypothetical protein ACRENG_25230, partial [bacterium]